jgi:hypothetical protein
MKGFSRRDLSREQHHQCPEQHGLPYLETESADLPDGNEDKHHQQNDYRDHNKKYAEAYFFSIIYY